mgnify:FL=1
MFPIDKWVFLALGADSDTRTLYGYRNYPASSSSMAAQYQTFVVWDTLYRLTSAGTAF